jgi:hypothetical protein
MKIIENFGAYILPRVSAPLLCMWGSDIEGCFTKCHDIGELPV